MKIPREARKLSRELFGLTVRTGKLDPAIARDVADTLLREKPRFYFLILKEFTRLVHLELLKHHALIESAEPLDAEDRAAVQQHLLQRFGKDTTFAFQDRPALLGGIRVKVGSDVWDGSVRARLDSLSKSLG